MYLVSRAAQIVTIGNEKIEFTAGETICTEYSHKYTVDEFASIAAASGLALHKGGWTRIGTSPSCTSPSRTDGNSIRR